MKLLEGGFALLFMALGVIALIFAIRSGSNSNHALPDSDKGIGSKLASPSLIACQSTFAAAFVARLAYLLIKEPRGLIDMISIIMLFIATEATLIMLAIQYRKSYSRLKGK